MQEIFGKIKERLIDGYDKESNSSVKKVRLCDAIEIVNQVAEEYNSHTIGDDLVKALYCLASQDSEGDCYMDHYNFMHSDGDCERMHCGNYPGEKCCPYHQSTYEVCFEDGCCGEWLRCLADKLDNDGWIPVSSGKLPEEKVNPVTRDWYVYPVMVQFKDITDIRYYSFGNGHWHHGPGIMDKYVTHWMDIKPYQPKGEK